MNAAGCQRYKERWESLNKVQDSVLNRICAANGGNPIVQCNPQVNHLVKGERERTGGERERKERENLKGERVRFLFFIF